MKTIKYIKTKISIAMGIVLLTTAGCERDLSEDAVAATFPSTAEVYTDAPVGLTDEFSFHLILQKAQTRMDLEQMITLHTKEILLLELTYQE